MNRTDAETTAHQLVTERFPGALAAWLGGSVVRGAATSTSDLDITVLLPGPPAPYRESLNYADWPVELFVHSHSSLNYYQEKDVLRRQPSIFRLVGESLVLVDVDGSGHRLRQESLDRLAAGPPPLSDSELRSQRYGLTDLIMDLEGATDRTEMLIIAAGLLQSAGTLLLTGAGQWTGANKGLLRELRAYDETHQTTWAETLPHGLIATQVGDIQPMVTACDRILHPLGGRLFEGFRLGGETQQGD